MNSFRMYLRCVYSKDYSAGTSIGSLTSSLQQTLIVQYLLQYLKVFFEAEEIRKQKIEFDNKRSLFYNFPGKQSLKLLKISSPLVTDLDKMSCLD